MKNILIITLASFFVSYSAYAESPEEKGLFIANEVDRHDQGWVDASMSIKMVLRNRQGDESSRKIRLKTLEVHGDGDKSLTIFDTPADVKGTSFLSYSHTITPDEQWLYMPALKRVKRINSANKSGPFMGSQFAYEDLSSFEVDKYKYKYLKDDKLNNINTFVVENYPLYEHSGYTRQLVWVDKERYIPVKIEYYDRKNTLLKTLKFSNYKQYLNKYWRALDQRMENHQNGKVTLLTFNTYIFKQGLSDSDFNRNSLKRSR
ncbi:MAG TPA: outer membrane lipoprotein-sorting protein [Gammaproteobacteria bacterium]|nr:outer membrane lipoprotein-sorting protein [Gammaproteobacteria bacterium]